MKRRTFLESAAGTAAVVTGFAGCTVDQKNSKETAPAGDRIKLAGKTLEELRDLYRYDLLEDYIPFLYEHVVDHEYGGFMCETDRDGTNITTNKRTWFEGRGIWVSSFLYNHIENDPKHLEVARKSVEFIMKLKPSGKEFWPGNTR